MRPISCFAVLAVAVALPMSAGPVQAGLLHAGLMQASLMGTVASALSAPDDIQSISFWAKPYPYGYRWRKTPCYRKVPECVRYVPETVCDTRLRPVSTCR